MTSKQMMEAISKSEQYHLEHVMISKKDADELFWLLRSREPRVLSIEEVHELKPGESAWNEWRFIEPNGDTRNTGVDQWVVTPDMEFSGPGIAYDDVRKVRLSSDADCIERYWSAEPTKEQMENTPLE